MRSRKKNNRSPRPFKDKSSDRGWSTGKRNDAFALHAGFMVRAKKSGTEAREAVPVVPVSAVGIAADESSRENNETTASS